MTPPLERPEHPHNWCATCGEDFGSVGAFDAHRFGTHAYLFDPGDPAKADGRRCLSVDEMEASPRFARNPRGLWSLSSDLRRASALHS